MINLLNEFALRFIAFEVVEIEKGVVTLDSLFIIDGFNKVLLINKLAFVMYDEFLVDEIGRVVAFIAIAVLCVSLKKDSYKLSLFLTKVPNFTV